MPTTECPGCFQSYDDRVLIARLQRDKISGPEDRVQMSATCPSCATLIYRTFKGVVKGGEGVESKLYRETERVPVSAREQEAMETAASLGAPGSLPDPTE